MKRFRHSIVFQMMFFTLVTSALVLSSCALGSEPAWKASGSDAVVSLTINAPAVAQNDSDGRAVFLSPGYLYIRTVGGPAGEKGPFYGPYAVTPGKPFSTTDIPAGNYEGIGVLYADEKLDEKTSPDVLPEFLGKTFAELMRLPDDQFMIFTDKENETNGGFSSMDALIDGQATGQLIKKQTIVSGMWNTLKVTLTPICGISTTVQMTNTTATEMTGEKPIPSGGANATKRLFLALDLEDIPAGKKISSISCRYEPSSSATVDKSAFYNQDGKLIGSVFSLGQVQNYAYQTKTVGVNSVQRSIGFYLDFSMPAAGDTLVCVFTANLVDDGVAPAFKNTWYVANVSYGDGSTPANACTLLEAITASNASSLQAGETNGIFLTGNVDMSVDLPVNRNVVINSVSGQQYTINFSGSLPGAPFYVYPTYSLAIYNVIIDGSGITSGISLLWVDGTAYLGDGCILQNNIKFSGDGAGVGVNGGILVIEGGTIQNCETTTGNGAAILLQTGSVYLNSGTITSNTANISGGGIYQAGGDLYLNGGSINSNVAATGEGGGLAVYGGVCHLQSASVTVSGNTAPGSPNSSAGAFFDGAAVLDDTVLYRNTIFSTDGFFINI